jgi:hypothetical protein
MAPCSKHAAIHAESEQPRLGRPGRFLICPGIGQRARGPMARPTSQSGGVADLSSPAAQAHASPCYPRLRPVDDLGDVLSVLGDASRIHMSALGRARRIDHWGHDD